MTKPAPKAKPATRRAPDNGLSPRAMLFVREYAKNPNGQQAAEAAGYSKTGAKVEASRLLTNPNVQAELAKLRDKATQRAEITIADIAGRYLAIADANPNDLIQFRRRCCRHCHGKGNEYEWTPREFKRAQDRYTDAMGDWEERDPKWRKDHKRKEPKPPEVGGGLGWDPRRDPNPDCPDCFGEGAGEAFIADTRHLSKEALSLYGGIEVTKDGYKVKLHSKPDALAKLGDHLGMFIKKHELTGKDGGPIEIALAERMKAARERSRKNR